MICNYWGLCVCVCTQYILAGRARVENCRAGGRSLNAAAWSCSRSITWQTNYWATDWLVMHETLRVKLHSETTQTVAHSLTHWLAQYWRRCCTPDHSRLAAGPQGAILLPESKAPAANLRSSSPHLGWYSCKIFLYRITKISGQFFLLYCFNKIKAFLFIIFFI